MNKSTKMLVNSLALVKRGLPTLGVGAILITNLAVAQVDTGGGMGGTGARRESELMNPAAGSDGGADCTRDKSIGIFEVKDKNTQRILRRDYACRGQILETSSLEIIELYLRTGEKIIALENSAIVVE
jgi:hypothetical protein